MGSQGYRYYWGLVYRQEVMGCMKSRLISRQNGELSVEKYLSRYFSGLYGVSGSRQPEGKPNTGNSVWTLNGGKRRRSMIWSETKRALNRHHNVVWSPFFSVLIVGLGFHLPQLPQPLHKHLLPACFWYVLEKSKVWLNKRGRELWEEGFLKPFRPTSSSLFSFLSLSPKGAGLQVWKERQIIKN